MKKSIWMILTLCCMSSISWAKTNTIRFATDIGDTSSRRATSVGHINDFDLDIAKAVCQQIKAQCIFKNLPHHKLLPGLEDGQYDAVLAVITDPALTNKNIEFTKAYYQPAAVFVAPKNKKYNLAAITGKKVGVQRHSNYLNYLKDKYHGKIDIKSFRTSQDALIALSLGKVDLILVDQSSASEWLKHRDNNKKFGIINKAIIDSPHFGAGYGIAVKKGNKALLEKFDTALYAIKKDGTYGKISRFYFGPI